MKNKLNDRDFITIGIAIYMAVVFAMTTTVIGGIICDLIIGNYESKGRMIIGYGTFALADFLGTVISVILFGTTSFVERASK